MSGSLQKTHTVSEILEEVYEKARRNSRAADTQPRGANAVSARYFEAFTTDKGVTGAVRRVFALIDTTADITG